MADFVTLWLVWAFFQNFRFQPLESGISCPADMGQALGMAS